MMFERARKITNNSMAIPGGEKVEGGEESPWRPDVMEWLRREARGYEMVLDKN